MVVFYMRNSLVPDGKIVPVTVSLNLQTIKDIAPPTLSAEANEIWLLTLSTTEVDTQGKDIDDEIINIISKDTIHKEIEAALGRIGSKIFWGTILPDVTPPRLIELIPPLSQTTEVSIFDKIKVRIQDPLPAAGLDLSTLQMSLTFLGKEFPIITSGIAEPGKNVKFDGNIFDFTILHSPKVILT